MWIEPAADASLRQRLYIKGANWAGFQNSGCPHVLWPYKGRTLVTQDYVDFLARHRFNAVRLPLSAIMVNDNDAVTSSCGQAYKGMPTLDVLDDVLVRVSP